MDDHLTKSSCKATFFLSHNSSKYARHCWRIKDVILWITAHRRTSVSQPEKTYMHPHYADTGGSLEDPPEAVDDRNEWWKWERERVRELRVVIVTWWWWWWWWDFCQKLNIHYWKTIAAFCGIGQPWLLHHGAHVSRLTGTNQQFSWTQITRMMWLHQNACD